MAGLPQAQPMQTNPAIEQYGVYSGQLQDHLEQSNPVKWRYLIANQVSFNQQQGYNIHLPKPDELTLYEWLGKIIRSEQAGVIFVENYQLPAKQHQSIQQLCQLHQVKLVNLQITQHCRPNNVIRGPW